MLAEGRPRFSGKGQDGNAIAFDRPGGRAGSPLVRDKPGGATTSVGERLPRVYGAAMRPSFNAWMTCRRSTARLAALSARRCRL